MNVVESTLGGEQAGAICGAGTGKRSDPCDESPCGAAASMFLDRMKWQGSVGRWQWLRAQSERQGVQGEHARPCMGKALAYGT